MYVQITAPLPAEVGRQRDPSISPESRDALSTDGRTDPAHTDTGGFIFCSMLCIAGQLDGLLSHCSDVNKDLGLKAKAKDLGPKAKAKDSRYQDPIFHRSSPYIICSEQYAT